MLRAKNELCDEAAGQPEDAEDPKKDDKEEPRTPLMSFINTDIAFAGDVMVVGSYQGFNVYRLQDDGVPELLSSVVCPGGQGDVSVVGDLLFMSAQETRGRLDCGLQGVSEEVSPERFRGLRIFDISELTRPVQVGAVQTCRGSHTQIYGTESVRGLDVLAPVRDVERNCSQTALNCA